MFLTCLIPMMLEFTRNPLGTLLSHTSIQRMRVKKKKEDAFCARRQGRCVPLHRHATDVADKILKVTLEAIVIVIAPTSSNTESLGWFSETYLAGNSWG